MERGGAIGNGTWRRAALVAHVFSLVVALAGTAFADTPAGAPASRVPKPGVAATAPGRCVEDTAFMRRNHMELLRHQRDLTVHDGIRTTKHSLANCVTCHADAKTGRVTGSKDAFCEGCHTYAGVKLDCFECHADRPKAAVANAGAPR
ncbi:MAG: hypothetical protein ABI886_11460 [Betaproteobacteria bacterium]